jgi:hypothetical protein
VSETIRLDKELCLYAVVNHEGKFFRSKGQYGNHGRTQWVDDINSARIYGKPGPANAVVSFYANSGSELPSPKLVQIVAERVEVVEREKKVMGALKPFSGCGFMNGYGYIEMMFGRKTVTANKNGEVIPDRSKWGRRYSKEIDTVKAFVNAIIAGGPPEPFADWIVENWSSLTA